MISLKSVQLMKKLNKTNNILFNSITLDLYVPIGPLSFVVISALNISELLMPRIIVCR